MDMQIRLLEQLYPNRHNPEHADHAQCAYLLLLEQQLAALKEKMEAEYGVRRFMMTDLRNHAIC